MSEYRLLSTTLNIELNTSRLIHSPTLPTQLCSHDLITTRASFPQGRESMNCSKASPVGNPAKKYNFSSLCTVPNLCLIPSIKVWSENTSWSYVMKLNNGLTIWFTPYQSKMWHIFISSKWLHQICPVFNFVRKKNMFGWCTAHTSGCREPRALYLCLDGSGRLVLFGTACVLWSLATLCIPPVPPTHTIPISAGPL